MPIIDFTGSYNDANRGMTLKALQARRQQLAEQAVQATQPQQIAAPTQGIAEMLGALGANMRASGAAQAEAAGRDKLAQLLSGGLKDPQSMAQAMVLDPETARIYQQNQWDQEKEAARQRFEMEQLAKQQGGQIDLEKMREGAATGLETMREGAATELEKLRAGSASSLETQREGAASELEKQRAASTAAEDKAKFEREQGAPQTDTGKIMQDFQTGKYGDPNSPEAKAAAAAEIKKATTPSGYLTDRSELWKQQDAYTNNQAAVNQLNEAKTILGQGINWGIGSELKTKAGSQGYLGEDQKSLAQRTIRYNTIMGANALMALAETLKGATSDKDVATFMTIMNNQDADPNTKAKAIDDMIAKINAHQELQRGRITALGGEMPQDQPAPKPDAKAAMLQEARDAIAKGADPALVKKRLVDKGYDPSEL